MLPLAAACPGLGPAEKGTITAGEGCGPSPETLAQKVQAGMWIRPKNEPQSASRGCKEANLEAQTGVNSLPRRGCLSAPKPVLAHSSTTGHQGPRSPQQPHARTETLTCLPARSEHPGTSGILVSQRPGRKQKRPCQPRPRAQRDPSPASPAGAAPGGPGAYPGAVAGTLVPVQQGVDQGLADAFEGGAGIPQLQQVGTEILPY